MVRLPEQVKAAVREQYKGRPYQEVAAAERRAVRDVAYLFHLVLACHREWYEREDRFRLTFLLLHEQLGRLLYEGPEGPLGLRHGPAWVRAAQRWLELAAAHLTGLGALDRACRQLGQRVPGDATDLLSSDASAELEAELGGRR